MKKLFHFPVTRKNARVILGISATFVALVVWFILGDGWIAPSLLLTVSLVWAVPIWQKQHECTDSQETSISDEKAVDIASGTWGLFGSLAREFNGQFDSIKSESAQVQNILSDAIGKLISSFSGMEEQSRKQQELAVDLTASGSGVTGDSEQMSYEIFLREVDRVLQALVDSSVANSHTAETLVKKMNQTSTQYRGILEMLGDVRKISNQTQMLGINAAIEAARAGKAGKGFAVVAEEVRNLAVRSNEFSEKIGESVSGIADALSSVETTVQEMAVQGTRVVSEARQEVEGFMEKTRSFNCKLEDSARQMSVISGRVEHDVRETITSLQFQDMATQVLSHISKRVEILDSVLDELACISRTVKMEANDLEFQQSGSKRLTQLQEAFCQASAAIGQARHNPVSQKSLDQGEIELF